MKTDGVLGVGGIEDVRYWTIRVGRLRLYLVALLGNKKIGAAPFMKSFVVQRVDMLSQEADE